MDTTSPASLSTSTAENTDYKNILIAVLFISLIFSLLGVNVLSAAGEFLDWLGINVFPKLLEVVGMLGFSTGQMAEDASSVAADTAKSTIDIADGVMHSATDIVKGVSATLIKDDELRPQLQGHIPESPDPEPALQSGEGKQSWCLIGDVRGVRNCAQVDDVSKCASGQIFPEQTACLMPNIDNVPPEVIAQQVVDSQQA